MSRKPTVPIEKFELDDLTKSIGFDREAVARLCVVSTESYGYWRFSGKIAREHLAKLTGEVVKRLGRRTNLNPVQQRALDYSRSFQSEMNGRKNSVRRKSSLARTKSKVDLALISLKELTVELERRGGEVSFKRAKTKQVR